MSAEAFQPGMAAEGRIGDLIALTERLTDLIGEQAQAFEAGRPQDAARHVEETARLANIYRREAQGLREKPDAIAGAARAERTRLLRATEAFDAVMQRQGRALDAARTITEGLVHAIAEEISHHRSANLYGADGAKASGPATAVTLNRRA